MWPSARRALRPLLIAGLAFGLAACAGESVWAPDEVVSQARYVPDGPARVTLLTMINNQSGAGGHTALLVDGPERILFDPAGSWRHPLVPERNDVLYGMTPQLYDFYIDYHARETYHVVSQEIDVSPAQAAALIEAAEAYGAVSPSQCTAAVMSVLRTTPGFTSLSRSLFPARAMAQFGQLPGVRETRIYDDDSDDNYELLNAQAQAAAVAAAAAEMTE
jgi:hypothetical protein